MVENGLVSVFVNTIKMALSGMNNYFWRERAVL